jgi:uncharacterized protein
VKPTPDRDSAPWWAALADHRLLVQRCTTCDALRWPARAMCNRCGSFDWAWVEVTGHGSVASYVVSHRPFSPAHQPPYVVVLARLEDQPDLLLPGGWDGARDGSDLAIGLPVCASYTDMEPGLALLSWRRSGDKEPA